jgi:hypothetical protein
MNAGKLLAFGGAGVAIWYFFLRTPSAASPTSPTQPASTAPVSNGSLDAAFQAMVTKSNGQTGTIDDWDSWLMQGTPRLVAPDPMPIFVAAIPNFDRATKMNAADYWKVMSPVIAKQYGLSGLGFFGAAFNGGRW